MSTTVAIVIASRDRASLLAETLTALGRQSMTPAEIIVVDDGSTDDTFDVAVSHGATVLRAAGDGPARARNMGWAASSASVIAFTDDDCAPEETWLERLVAPIVDGDADLVQGVTLPRADQQDDAGPWSHTMRVTEHVGNYPTCNMAYRRSVLDGVNGFDETFPHPAAEDTDLAWRALEQGARVAFVADAIVHHAVWDLTFTEHLRRSHRWESIPRLIARHPDARSLLYRRYVWRRTHARALRLVGLGTILALVHPAAGAGAVAAFALRQAWVAHRQGKVVPTSTGRAFLQLFADTYEVAVLALGSIRHRTLVL